MACLCRCRTCGYVFDNPRPTVDEIVRYYSKSSLFDSWMAEEAARNVLWQRRLRAGFEGYIRVAHQFGVPVMHHTCGSIYRLLPQFVECGLDILQALQPGVAEMDFHRIKAEYGDRLCFQGAISIQRALPFGSPADVRAEVRERIQALAPGGGYIISTAHNIQGDTPVENILALIEAYNEFGRYR